MKRLSTFLVFAFLGLTGVKAQSDLLYVAGENDNVAGNAPTLYVQGSADLYVEGGVVASGSNTRTSKDGLLQVNGTLHIGDYSGVAPGNFTNATNTDLYTYNNSTLPSAYTYAPGATITYGANANAVSLEYGNQLIQATGSPASPTHFFVLSLPDVPAANNFKTIVGADIYVGVTSLGYGGLDLNNEYLMTQDNSVHIENPSTSTSGTSFAISRLFGGSLENAAPFHENTSGGMVVAGHVQTLNETHGRLTRVTNSTGTYFFPVGSLTTVPTPNVGQNYDLFRPASINLASSAATEFAVALVPDDGFADAGYEMDQSATAFHSLAGINHEYYYKINQIGGTLTNGQQITLTHQFSNNSDANSYPNWSTCGNLPAADFPQTVTIAQWDNNGTNLSWNDVCHGSSPYTENALATCGSVTVTPNTDFCNNTIVNPSPNLDQTTTVAYNVPGSYTTTPGASTQEDYTVAGLFFNVDGGTGTCDGNCAALPLNIVSLTGWNVGNANQIQWVTATEENVDYFMVEKSIDGINFKPITEPDEIPSKVGGYSSNPTTYDYTDNSPNMGNNYYRVREILKTTQYLLTNVINVPLNKQITIANVYPNPTTDKLNVDFVTSLAGTVHVEVYDVLGRLILSNDDAVNEGTNSMVVNTTNLTAGSYFIRLTDATSNFTDTQKFIKITE